MDEKLNNPADNTRRKPYVMPHVDHPTEVAKNPNPKANENIRVRTEEPENNNNKTEDVGSEITDGEDA